MKADALATALFAMGEEKAWNYSFRNKIPVYMILEEGHGKLATKISPDFPIHK